MPELYTVLVKPDYDDYWLTYVEHEPKDSAAILVSAIRTNYPNVDVLAPFDESSLL